MKKRTKIFLWITIPLLSILLVAFIGTVAFLKQSYQAVDVDLYLESSDTVKVQETDAYIFFDSPSTERVIIMYGGANVEEKAYAPICRKLAESDYDVFLLKTFEEFALLDINKANAVLNRFEYENISLMGHSLGGVAATSYLKNSNEEIDNLIYLASFPNVDISKTDINVISIQATLDGVTNRDSLEKAKKFMPASFHELWIEGGNHAQFGSYGKQSGDCDASISFENQLNQICDFILENIK